MKNTIVFAVLALVVFVSVALLLNLHIALTLVVGLIVVRIIKLQFNMQRETSSL